MASVRFFDLMQMLETSRLNSKILAASLRTEQVHALISGIDAVAAHDIVYTMMDHPGTKFAVDRFPIAWRGLREDTG